MIIRLYCFVLLLSLSIFSFGQSVSEKDIRQDLTVFQSPLASQLKKNMSLARIRQMKDSSLKSVALAMHNGKYRSTYKLATYTPILSPVQLGKNLSIGDGYSKYEGISGIFLKGGTHIVLVEGIPKDKKVSLYIPKWLRHAPAGIEPTKDPAGWGLKRQTINIANGLNVINVSDSGGLAYINYSIEGAENLPPIKVHFVDGQVNGYFDSRKDDDQRWNELITNAIYPIMDAKGKHIQFAYPVEDLKKYTWNKGRELIQIYDSMIGLQYRLMGLEKYNLVPQNHILARVNYNYYMFRDGDGVAYMGTGSNNTMHRVLDPQKVSSGDASWGFNHEVGHVHQLRPYFNWSGLGEVSNNVFTMYVTTLLTHKSRLMESHSYDSARKEVIDARISYLQSKDLFVKLVPFWQLQLYFSGAGKNADFYPDLFQTFRQQAQSKALARHSNAADYQLNFVEQACLVSKTDLTDFFDQYGFFFVGEFPINDYGKANYKMTSQMVEACKQKIKGFHFSKPKIDISSLRDE